MRRAEHIGRREATRRIRYPTPEIARKYGATLHDPQRGEFEGALFEAMHPDPQTGLANYAQLKALLQKEGEHFRLGAERDPFPSEGREKIRLFGGKLSEISAILPAQGEPFIPPSTAPR